MDNHDEIVDGESTDETECNMKCETQPRDVKTPTIIEWSLPCANLRQQKRQRANISDIENWTPEQGSEDGDSEDECSKAGSKTTAHLSKRQKRFDFSPTGYSTDRPQQLPAKFDDFLFLQCDKKTRPPLAEYSRLLAKELRHFSKLFIVIDALDECSEAGRIREQFMIEVEKLLPSVSLLVTSRDIPDMEWKFRGAARLDIYASDGDIRRYLESRIKRELAGFSENGTTLQSDILVTIVEKAQGM